MSTILGLFLLGAGFVMGACFGWVLRDALLVWMPPIRRKHVTPQDAASKE